MENAGSTTQPIRESGDEVGLFGMDSFWTIENPGECALVRVLEVIESLS